ncbi:DcaP family trimeric outer membrane transporter [Salinimonas chungwhensis]|uniref:DcaP family trimeric outer membrane transporter n=1 Tax=Salinimonas chungwhensis TaxID=265425 RepID=UPI000378D616|nr:DcaP family trimeric outer membrane transporter [Salinimonas chungwhensis]
MKNTLKKTAVVCAMSAVGLGVNAATLDDTKVSFSGYIKTDALISDYSDGTLASGSIGREFYIPSLTPVGGPDEDVQFDAHIRQSRFRFTTETPADGNETIKGVLELDFLVTDGGNERISSSYLPRVRHAYIQYKNWLVGQTWTTFMDVSILPETLDFIGVTDGITFNRQTMLRYTNGGLQIALENPETTVTPFGGAGRIVADDNSVPDLIAAYTMQDDWGHVKVAGLVRQLSYNDGALIDDDETGYGIAISSKINLGSGDDIRMMFNTGVGMGRYSSLNTANGVVITQDNQLETIDSYGYSLAYRHMWSERARSSVTFSALNVDNDTALTGMGVTESTYSTRVNYLYSPTSAITVGAEYTFAKREIEAGLEGDMNRIQISAKYAF